MGGLVVGLVVTQAGRGHQPQGADDAAALVAENIAEHVFHDHDIELARVEAQVRGRGIHQHVHDFHVGVIRRHLLQDLVPQHAGFEHVALVDIVQHALAPLCQFECLFQYLLDLDLVVTQRFFDIAVALRVGAEGLGAKVQASDQLPDQQDVDTLADDLRPQRRKLGKSPGQHYGPKIGVGAVARAQRQHRAAFRLQVHRDLPGGLVGQSHRTLDDGVGRIAGRLGGFRKGMPVVEVGLGAEGRLDQFEARLGMVFHHAQHLECLLHDLRTDAVAGQYCDAINPHEASWEMPNRGLL